MNGRETEREIERYRPTDRVKEYECTLYRRHNGVDDSWLNVSTVPRQKRGKIEILSKHLRISSLSSFNSLADLWT